MLGEKIYEYVVDLTGTIEYGLSLADVVAGTAAPPLHGARFDAGFAGQVKGRLQGSISGTDFAFLRPDGVLELNIHATIDAGNGVLIAMWADGIGRFRAGEPIIDLAENVRLTTSHESHLWVNGRQIWATGTADLEAGKVSLQGFLQ
ncbi:DUF3237 family protein [Sandarakinorhabdus sp. AAP62]|uniref:DUF3237 family protein n=1 Tax=Sandarakinorhabdus sp. AAP62 TaxID=1248916 RepID=UPI000305134E|nr:DUF3237 family protein [Sandarakinorhabdus sp. AAP62]